MSGGYRSSFAALAILLAGPGVQLVGTCGGLPTVVRAGARPPVTLAVPAVGHVESDHGAGDVYLGGYLAATLAGGGIEQAHRAGCAAARPNGDRAQPII